MFMFLLPFVFYDHQHLNTLNVLVLFSWHQFDQSFALSYHLIVRRLTIWTLNELSDSFMHTTFPKYNAYHYVVSV